MLRDDPIDEIINILRGPDGQNIKEKTTNQIIEIISKVTRNTNVLKEEHRNLITEMLTAKKDRETIKKKDGNSDSDIGRI